MDGVRRAFDNIMIERLWRTVKYEDVYIRSYETPAEARLGLGIYFSYYNHLRSHTSLGKRTPAEAYGLAISASDEKALATRASRSRIIETDRKYSLPLWFDFWWFFKNFHYSSCTKNSVPLCMINLRKYFLIYQNINRSLCCSKSNL